jgi:PadR family transcriptional regulator PadR
MTDPVVREFLLAFWKIHILHHAAEQGVYGHWMLEELRHHGYRLSPGTLYPVLARMAERGWLKPARAAGSRAPRVYHITPAGSAVLERLRTALDELQHEVTETASAPRRRRASGKRRARRPATRRA